MFGLLLAALWLVLFGLMAVRWESTGKPAVTRTQGPGGPSVSVDMPVQPHLRSPLLLALAIGLTPFAFVFGNNCVLTIPPAHVAAVYDPLRGGVQQQVLPEGFHIVMPWWQTEQFSQQTQEYTMSGSSGPAAEGAVPGEGAIRCQTNEGMNVEVDCTVLFHVDPKDANDLWQQIGDDYIRIITRPYVQNIMRMVVAKYSVVDVYSAKRKEIEQEIVDTLRPRFQEKGLVFEQLLIRNVQYGNPAFSDAINAKQVAEQQVQTETQKLERAKIEKQTAVAEAQGEAQAIVKRGATLRQNPEVVQYEYVQKIAPRLKTMYLPAGSLPVIKGGQ